MNCSHEESRSYREVSNLLRKYFYEKCGGYISNGDHADYALHRFWKSLPDDIKSDFVNEIEGCDDCRDNNDVEAVVKYMLLELNEGL